MSGQSTSDFSNNKFTYRINYEEKIITCDSIPDPLDIDSSNNDSKIDEPKLDHTTIAENLCEIKNAKFEKRFVDGVYNTCNDSLDKNVHEEEDDDDDDDCVDHNCLRDRVVLQDSSYEWDSENCFSSKDYISTFHDKNQKDQLKPETFDDMFEDAEED